MSEPGWADTSPLSAEYSEDGVDISLIRWTLSLTPPPERLQSLEDRINDILKVREWNARSSW